MTVAPRPPHSFMSTFFYRSLRDLFSRMQRPESDAIVIDSNELKVWMVGHATALINLFGTTILTDPVLVSAIPFPRRIVAAGYDFEDLPPLDYILVSHAHLDHCNKPSLRKLAAKTKTIIVPRNCADLVADMNFPRIVELDWDKNFTDGELTITAYRVEHWGERVPWERLNRGFNCYVLQKARGSVLFGGDTGYGKFFKHIGAQHTIDLALLPISAYNPPSFRAHHMDPADALQAALDLGARHVVPIHWGNFRLSLESLLEPPELFMALAKEKGMLERAHLLPNGKSFSV